MAGAAGWRSCSLAYVTSVSGAGFSSEVKIRIAAFMLPSSTFDVIAAASCAAGSLRLWKPTKSLGSSSSESCSSTVVRFFIMEAKL